MEVLLVADDLTGAMDAGQGFARRGHDVLVRVGTTSPLPDDGTGHTVLAVNTDTRYAPANVARETVCEVVREAATGEALVYLKLDSTLRGNVLESLEAAIDATDATLAILAPAFPTAGRTTEAGIHLVDGVPLTRTEYARDENGASTADLPELCSELGYPVTHVPVETLESGVADLFDGLQRTAANDARPRVLVFDATEPEHLESIAEAAAHADERLVYAGSGGLANHVRVPSGVGRALGGGRRADAGAEQPAIEDAAVADPAAVDRGRTGVLGVVGSVADRTLTQLEAVPARHVVALEPKPILEAPTAAGRDAGGRAASRIERDGCAVLTAAPTRSSLAETLERGERAGLEETAVRTRVRRALAAGAAAAVDAQAPAGLFLTGGDVAVAVLETLEATAVALSGEEVTDGVPRGVVATGTHAGTAIVTKAGGFGTESTIVTGLRTLRNDDT